MLPHYTDEISQFLEISGRQMIMKVMKVQVSSIFKEKKSWRSVRRTRTRSVVSTVHHLDHYLTDEGMFNWSQNIATNLTVKRS